MLIAMGREREFEEYFFRDLEKGFSADIACCDQCVTDFLGRWPLTEFVDNAEFNSAHLSLEYFYSIGFTQERFSKDEFMEYSENIRCPFCCRGLTSGFWPYNLPIDVSPKLEQEIEEVGEIAISTPFLVLTHPLAQRMFAEIKKLASSETAMRELGPLYRARVLESGSEFKATDFGPPPPAATREGRYNHAGRPVLYLADSKLTCWREMREPSAGVAIAEISLSSELRILNLVKKLAVEHSIFQTLVWSSLLSSPDEGEGWKKPHYAFTRFLADCATSAGFDAIRYPSVRKDMGTNLVVLSPTCWTQGMTVKAVSNFDLSNADSLRAGSGESLLMK